MNTNTTCQHCGKALGSEVIEGLCPECLMKMGLGLGTEATGGPPQGKRSFQPPSLAELAPKFPQLELVAFIGQGGMGAVYKARQKQLDRLVALKILPPGIGDTPAFAERFAREAKAMARLNHPGIVTIHDFGDAGGLYYFIMELVDGVSLRELTQGGRLAPREALAIVPRICDALQYAHDHGIVHRDIKPENILLDRQGRLKVADFGLAKLVGAAGEPATMGAGAGSADATEAGKVMGTPSYMAPEQVEHPGDVDHRADIYALGVVFYQMLTGELPGKRLQPPSTKVEIDVRLDEVVLRALAKEPARRYQQVSQVKTAVETITQHPQAAKGNEPTSWPRWFQRPSAQIAAVIMVLLAAGLFLAARAATARRQAAIAELAARERQTLLARLTTKVNGEADYPGRLDTNAAPKPVPGAPIPVQAGVALTRDIGLYLDSLGTVEASNSISFAVAQDYVQPLVKKFDAHLPLPVEVCDRQGVNRVGHGALIGIENRIDQATGTLTCRASLVPEGDRILFPGMMFNVRLLLEMKHDVVVARSLAIQRDPQGAFVFVLKPDQTVTRRAVAVGVTDRQETEITSGLSAGEAIAMDQFARLSEGSKVLRTVTRQGETNGSAAEATTKAPGSAPAR